MVPGPELEWEGNCGCGGYRWGARLEGLRTLLFYVLAPPTPSLLCEGSELPLSRAVAASWDLSPSGEVCQALWGGQVSSLPSPLSPTPPSLPTPAWAPLPETPCSWEPPGQ